MPTVLEQRLHDGLDENVCSNALLAVEIINRLPEGFICICSELGKICKVNGVYAEIDEYTLRITWITEGGSKKSLLIDDYKILSAEEYLDGDGVVIYTADGDHIELVACDEG